MDRRKILVALAGTTAVAGQATAVAGQVAAVAGQAATLLGSALVASGFRRPSRHLSIEKMRCSLNLRFWDLGFLFASLFLTFRVHDRPCLLAFRCSVVTAFAFSPARLRRRKEIRFQPRPGKP